MYVLNLNQVIAYSIGDIVFVTAVSANHFDESRDAIASVQIMFPHVPIIYYNLGLDHLQIIEVNHSSFSLIVFNHLKAK